MTQAGLKDNSAPAEEELTMNLGYEPVHLRFVGPMIRHDPSPLPTRTSVAGLPPAGFIVVGLTHSTEMK